MNFYEKALQDKKNKNALIPSSGKSKNMKEEKAKKLQKPSKNFKHRQPL